MDEVELTEEQLAEVTDAIVAGNKIEAIKIYRDATGSDLMTAKGDVEDLIKHFKEKNPDWVQPKSGGCLGILILAFLAISAGDYGLISSFMKYVYPAGP